MRCETESRLTSPFDRRPLLSLSSFILAIAVGIISSFTLSTAYDMARSAIVGERQTVSGVWRGSWQGVPAVTIRLEQQGDAMISGTARFSKIIATNEGPKAVGETGELPLVNPQFDGERLLFEVESADESYTAAVSEMEMSFAGEGEAELRRTGGQPEGAPADQTMRIKMRKERSF
ncbi:MAG TPA: hypothetical protein VGC66_11870 [Pyrinomonadaceae bacterium]|jgi:hypothetical protein